MSFGKRYVHVHGDKVGPMMTVRPGAGREVRPETTLEVDLDIARPFNRPEHEHHERMYMYHYERTVETGRALGLTINRDAEVEGLRREVADARAECERMRSVLDTVEQYRTGQPASSAAETVATMSGFTCDECGAQWISGGHPVCVSCRQSQAVTPGTLTPAQWAALFELHGWLVATEPTFLSDETERVAAIAIDLLRSQAHANRNQFDETDLRRLREAIANYDDYTGGAQRIVTLLRSLLDAGKLGGRQ